MAFLLLTITLCIFISIIPSPVSCNCPVYGCTLFHSFTSPTQFFNSSHEPQLLWKFEHPELRPTGAGCVTNGGRIICPMVVHGQEQTMLISWEALTNGKSSWNVTSGNPNFPLPVVDISGEILASNGYELLGFTSNGKPFGKPISLYPIHGQVMDLVVSSEQFLILLYKCGFFAVYITNGIPHASIWLNDTLGGQKGTFIPLNNPAINSSSSERLYTLTAFRPKGKHSIDQDVKLRLYAFDVTGQMAYRIQTIWYYDFILPSALIPYLESKETVCKVFYPPDRLSYNSKHDHEYVLANATQLPADIVTRGNVVFITLNYKDAKSNASHCWLLSVTNLGKNYSINFSKATFYQCYGMAYNSHESTIMYFNSYQAKQLMVWQHVFEPAHGSSLLLIDMYSGDAAMNVSLTTLLGKSGVKITSQMLIAYLYLGNNTISHTSHLGQSANTPIPLIFGVTDSSGEGSVVAIDLSPESDMKIIWRVPLTNANQYISGQICTVDRLRDSLMVFTDQSGVYFYKIS